jgi:tetratricopeptide (TPR) repeat protein
MTKTKKWKDVDSAMDAGELDEACHLLIKNIKPCVNFYHYMGKIKLAQGRTHLAVKCLKTALAMHENNLKKTAETDGLLCPKILKIVDHLSRAQNPKCAEIKLRNYMELAAQKFDVKAQVTLGTRLGHILIKLKRVEEAREMFMECFTAIAVFKSLFSELDFIQNHCNIAQTFIGFDNSRARKMSADISKHTEETFGEDHLNTLNTKMCEVMTLHETGEKCSALELVIDLVKNYVKLLGVDHPKTKRAVRYSFKMNE